MATLEPSQSTNNEISETSPLLPNRQESALHEHSEQHRPLAVHSVEDEPEPWTTRDKVLYAVCGVLLVAILAIIIVTVRTNKELEFDWERALKQALGGGLSGAAAMILQVLTLMPLRTIMNYQYRFGTSTRQATVTLYRAGGYRRYYSGLGPALIQAPVARFGDTAANVGALALLESNPLTRGLPSLVKTAFSTIFAATFRIVLMPIDTLKTTLQTQGRAGIPILRNRIHKYGVHTLWYGAMATAAATAVGYYPWFGTYDFLQDHLPRPVSSVKVLFRQALIGFIASVVSDTVSNSLRVVKTYRQVNSTKISYRAAAREVVRVDGIRGLLGRGLKTRILANGLQGLMFSVLWKIFMDLWNSKT